MVGAFPQQYTASPLADLSWLCAPFRMRTSLGNEPFQVLTEGTCADAGANPIVTEAGCEAAARSLGLADTSVDDDNEAQRPEGCYWFKGYRSCLSTRLENKGKGAETSSGAERRYPICARREYTMAARARRHPAILLPVARWCVFCPSERAHLNSTLCAHACLGSCVPCYSGPIQARRLGKLRRNWRLDHFTGRVWGGSS